MPKHRTLMQNIPDLVMFTNIKRKRDVVVGGAKGGTTPLDNIFEKFGGSGPLYGSCLDTAKNRVTQKKL